VINCRAFTAGSSPTSRLPNPFITTLTASHQCYHKSHQEERSFASFLQPVLELRTRLSHH